jgi:hypothetical protein
MNDRSRPHDRHDRHLVAALAADDLEPTVRADAEALVASCRDCAELLADLRVIALATAALPDVPRTRDFRITAADAARLRPSGWRALLDALGGARSSFSRPLAVGLTTIGLVGLLATTIPGALGGLSLGSAASAPEGGRYGLSVPAPGGVSAGGASAVASTAASAAPAAVSSAAASAADFGKGVEASGSSPRTTTGLDGQVAASPSPAAPGGVSAPGSKDRGGPVPGRQSEPSGDTNAFGAQSAGAGAAGPPLGLIASLVCLAAGLGLFVLGWSARRLDRR